MLTVLTPELPHFQPPHSVPTSVPRPMECSSYYAIRKVGRHWAVQLVTPCGPKPLRTTIATFADGHGAIGFTEQIAAELKRPSENGELAR